MLDWLSQRYSSVLRWALGRPAAVLAATLAVAALAVLLFTQLETGFLPEMDEGGYIVDYWTPEGTSLPETDRMLKRLEAVLQDTPEVASFARRTGAELGHVRHAAEHRRHRGATQAALGTITHGRGESSKRSGQSSRRRCPA